MEVSQGQARQTIDYYVKGDRMRIEPLSGPGGGQVMIVDMEKKEVLMVVPAQRMYMALPLPDAGNGNSDEARPEPQGETREILGYQAQKYLLRQNSAVFEIWATDELGKLGGLRLPTDRPGAAGTAGSAIAQAAFFPLIITERRGDQVVTQVTMLEVEPKTVDDALFQPPADFRRMAAPVPAPQQR